MKGLDDIIGKIEALVIDLRDISRESEAHQSPPEVRDRKKSGPYVLIHQNEITERDIEIVRLREAIGELSDDLLESRAEALLLDGQVERLRIVAEGEVVTAKALRRECDTFRAHIAELEARLTKLHQDEEDRAEQTERDNARRNAALREEGE